MGNKIHPMIFGILMLATATSGFNPAGRQGDQPETRRVYLSGTGSEDAVDWEFFCTADRKSGYWTTIRVPSCWEQEGFGQYNYGVNYYGKATDPEIPTEQGRYRHRFDVPEEWKGKMIRLVFEGSMTDTRVKVNGRETGPLHQGGFYRFGYDVSSLLAYGRENLLEVEVSKESANTSVNLAERRADYWNFGGIFRPVFLEIMPHLSILRMAIDARADGSLRADVFLSGNAEPGCKLLVRMADPDDRETGTAFVVPVPTGSDSLSLRHQYDGIMQWTAETPSLYNLSISLMSGDRTLHRVSERIGFRTFEIREGDGFYLNGQRILLKGVNRHSFRPESGRTLSPRQNYEDVRRIKEMNMNTVRMSHYPPDPEFLDACDELGLYVLNELGGWHGHYDTEVGRKLVMEMVTRDVNHPSVIFWDNGNEGGWNTELDDDFYRWDPQDRPVLHPQQELNGVETMHYRSYGETQEYLRGECIYFPTEFLHGLYDGGHGAGLYDYWEMMRQHPRCGGGLLWAFADEGLMRTDLGDSIDTDGNHGADGILGPHHEVEGSFNTIREIWSPVCIDMKKIPGKFYERIPGKNEGSIPGKTEGSYPGKDDGKIPIEFDGRIPMENRYDFINLKNCTFKWELARFYGPADKKSGHRVMDMGMADPPDIRPHAQGIISLDLPRNWREADVLYLTARDPEGKEIWTWSWKTGSGAVVLPAQQASMAPQTSVTPQNSVAPQTSVAPQNERLSVNVGQLRFDFTDSTGLLEGVDIKGRYIPFGGGPRFVAARRGDRTLDGTLDPDAPEGLDRVYPEIQYESRLLDTKVVRKGDTLVISSRYFGPMKSLKWTVYPDGILRLDYLYRYDGVVELMGIGFDYPESGMRSIRWLGEGPYRVWQNRLHGTRLNVWENQYNDPVPAQTFTYPEFKGYFGSWSWASFGTVDGTIHIRNQDPEKYLGVYTPRDGRDALLYTLPETGIAILDVIPAVRNKVNATDLIGPSSRARHISGPQGGTLYFAFE